MQIQTTLGIIKPDASMYATDIISMITSSELQVSDVRHATLSEEQIAELYDPHRDKPFFDSLCKFMASGPVVLMQISGLNAIDRFRTLMGTTDPKKALQGTIRAKYGTNIDNNAVHGSDSTESAQRELRIFGW